MGMPARAVLSTIPSGSRPLVKSVQRPRSTPSSSALPRHLSSALKRPRSSAKQSGSVPRTIRAEWTLPVSRKRAERSKNAREWSIRTRGSHSRGGSGVGSRRSTGSARRTDTPPVPSSASISRMSPIRSMYPSERRYPTASSRRSPGVQACRSTAHPLIERENSPSVKTDSSTADDRPSAVQRVARTRTTCSLMFRVSCMSRRQGGRRPAFPPIFLRRPSCRTRASTPPSKNKDKKTGAAARPHRSFIGLSPQVPCPESLDPFPS